MKDYNGNRRQRVVLFAPLNAAGHMQSSLAIADKLRADFNYKCIFLIAGPPHTNIIEDHGHELIVVEDPAPMWDYEVESGDEQFSDDDARDEHKRQRGMEKRKYEGSKLWSQFMERNKRILQVDGKESARGLAHLVDTVSLWTIKCNEPLDKEIERIQPDLIVADTMLPQPSILRAQHTRPWVRLFSPNPFSLLKSKLPGKVKPPRYQGWQLYDKSERARLRADDPEKWQSILHEWNEAQVTYKNLTKDFEERVDKYYKEHGYHYTGGDESGGVMCISSPHLNVYMFPEALDYTQDDDIFEYPSRWLRCDSLVRNACGSREQVECQLWAKQLNERRGKFKFFVYLSLGSIASGSLAIMRRLIGYLNEDKDAEILYIVSKGLKGDSIELDPRNMLGGNYLPQTFILQHCDLAVIHGGNNSLTESLYFGKPVIVLPAFGDQHDNAQRVADLKLGRRLDLYKCTSKELLGAIKETLADGDLRSKVRVIGERMRSRDELGKVTRLLSVLAEGGRLDDQLTPRAAAKVELENS